MTMHEMTFDTFLCDDSAETNRTVKTLTTLHKNPIQAKVLCIWGGNSTGKTHLLHAVENTKSSQIRLYLTSDQLSQKLSHAIKEGQVAEFVESFANVDILLIDDAQFLAANFILELLYSAIVPRIHQYVILASDCDPQAIGLLSNDGIVLRLEEPSLAVRKMFVLKIADSFQLQLDEAVQSLIATELTDFRRISGLLTFLKAMNIGKQK